MLILESAEQKKKKGVEDKMGWATAHFQFCVMTLQWCRDRRGAMHAAGSFARTIKDLRSRARACHGRPVATNLLGFSVATENPLSRQSWLTLCRDRDF